MPTVMRVGPYRFFFYSSDGIEPRHIHVDRDDAIAKFWLEPIRLARSGGFDPTELRDIERIVTEHEKNFAEAWNDYFGS